MEIKPIENYPLYSVSSDGRIFGPNGEIKGWITPEGYRRVSITNESGSKSFSVHRLVADAFVPGRSPEKSVVDHIDCNKSNNNAENLRWCTREDNIRYAYENGLFGYAPKTRYMHAVILENTETGEKERFESINAAAKAHDLPYWTLHNIYKKKGSRKTVRGYTIYPV